MAARHDAPPVVAEPVRPRHTMLVPIPIYTALLAVTRAVDLAHVARADRAHTLCSTCQTLRALDDLWPRWRTECIKMKVASMEQ